MANWRIIKRILIFIIIPLLLSIFLLFSPFEKIPVIKHEVSENLTTMRISKDEIFKPSIKNTLRGIIEVPFDLEWYNLCFSHGISKFYYQDGEVETAEINATLTFNDRTLIIPSGKTECVLYNLDKDFTPDLSFEFGMNATKMIEKYEWKPINETTCVQISTCTLEPGSFEYYAKPTISGIIIKNILVLFAFWGLVLLFIGIWSFIMGNKSK